MTEEEMGEIII